MPFPIKKKTAAPVEALETNEPQMPMKKKGMPMKKKGKPAPAGGPKPAWKGVADKMLGKC